MKAKYKTLGLKKGASQEEIQEAYDRLSKELDPITNNNETFFVEQLAKVRQPTKPYLSVLIYQLKR